MGTVAICFAINLASNVWRGDPMPFLILNPMMNLFQVDPGSRPDSQGGRGRA